MSGPRIGSLFAGYGGLDLALAEVWPDAHPVWFSQYDPDGGTRQAPSRILAHHWPDIPNLGDITAIDWSAVEPVDIITGGSPCQDLSHAGKRAGMKAGTRSGLWASMCDAIDTLRPSLVIWENVRGAYSATAVSAVEPCPICVGERPGVTLRALGRVLGDLAECGYDAAWVGLRAADVGAPHGRFRVFVLAWPQSDTGALTWPQSDTGALTWPQSDTGALLPTPAVNDMGAAYTPETWDAWTDRMKAAHGNGNGHGASLSIEALRLLPSPRTSDTNGAGTHGDGGLDLRTAVTLLPTPRATDGENRQSLDRYGMNLGQALGVTPLDTEDEDADTTEGRPGQDVPGVREDVQPRPVQRDARGSDALPITPDLLAELREHEAHGDEGRAALAGAEAQGASVRGVSDDDAAARSPRRSEPGEQRPGEPRDPLRVMPPAAALAGGPAEADGGSGSGCGDSAGAWGAYAPAIRRWEMVLGRPAPAPTEPTGRDGAHRLSPRAVEFMMGLSDGWVTDVPGITRNDMLKALGNGVVPQQAAEAVRWLLEVRATAEAA